MHFFAQRLVICTDVRQCFRGNARRIGGVRRHCQILEQSVKKLCQILLAACTYVTVNQLSILEE